MESDIKEELKKDLTKFIKKIDFSKYNPSSIDFQTALQIGLMLFIINSQFDDVEVIEETNTIEYPDIHRSITNIKKNLSLYEENKDKIYLNLVDDEIKVAEQLIKKSLSKLPSAKNKEQLKQYEIEIDKIKSYLN